MAQLRLIHSQELRPVCQVSFALEMCRDAPDVWQPGLWDAARQCLPTVNRLLQPWRTWY